MHYGGLAWAVFGRAAFFVGGTANLSQSATRFRSSVAVLLITKETHNEQTINLAVVRNADTP